MTVHSNFERKYRFAPDPWQVTNTPHYYQELRDFICRWRDHSSSALDCGCGEGHFTSQLREFCKEVHGVDGSKTAIERARKQYPGIHWHANDLRNITKVDFPLAGFDLIVCSQVLYYFAWSEAAAFLNNLEQLLSTDGLLCVAAYCPGGDYFSPSELHALVEESFEIIDEQRSEQHVLLAAVRRPVECVVTVDYEAWDYYDEKRAATPDIWEQEVIQPCAQLMQVCEEFRIPLTIFLEIGEYWFLERYLPESAARIRAQLAEAVSRGHDVQVHLHTRWMPDFGAGLEADGRTILLSRDVPRLHDLPPNTLEDIFTKARSFLESLLQPVREGYRANVFRGGKYQIQPHEAIFRALEHSGYQVDSSVWHGGSLSSYDRNPGFDFRSLWHPWRPYRPSRHDVCAPAAPGEVGPAVVEIPILAFNAEQWSFDAKSADEMHSLWLRLRSGGGPRVMIGHTKTVNSEVLQNFRQLLNTLSSDPGVVFSSFQKTAETWHARCQTASYQEARKAYVRRSSRSPADLFASLAPYHRRKVELLEGIIARQARERGHVRVLDIGCGTGELVTLPLYHRLNAFQQVTIQGIDIDQASIARAAETASAFSLERISFDCLPLQEVAGEFDVVICSEVLEHLSDPLTFVQLLSQRVAAHGRLVLTAPNGYGYGEIERRIFYRGYELAQRMPLAVKKWLLRGYRMSREWLKARLLMPSGSASPLAPPIMETLNFQDNIHVQRFLLPRLTRLLRKANLDVEQVCNVQCLGGVVGTILERKLVLDRWLDRMPATLVADWMFVCRMQERRADTSDERVGNNFP